MPCHQFSPWPHAPLRAKSQRQQRRLTTAHVTAHAAPSLSVVRPETKTRQRLLLVLRGAPGEEPVVAPLGPALRMAAWNGACVVCGCGGHTCSDARHQRPLVATRCVLCGREGSTRSSAQWLYQHPLLFEPRWPTHTAASSRPPPSPPRDCNVMVAKHAVARVSIVHSRVPQLQCGRGHTCQVHLYPCAPRPWLGLGVPAVACVRTIPWPQVCLLGSLVFCGTRAHTPKYHQAWMLEPAPHRTKYTHARAFGPSKWGCT